MNTSPRKAQTSRFRYRRYGVYDLTYEDVARPLSASRIYSLLDGFRAIFEAIPHVKRQIADMIMLAPAEFVAYVIITVWKGIYSAINLYWLSVLFDKVLALVVHTNRLLLFPAAREWFRRQSLSPRGVPVSRYLLDFLWYG